MRKRIGSRTRAPGPAGLARTGRRVAVAIALAAGLSLAGARADGLVAQEQPARTGPSTEAGAAGWQAARVASPGARLRVPVGSAPDGVEVDGALDDAAWRDAPAVGLAWEVAPGDNAPAPVETACRLAYDGEHLYLGCRALDPEPASIRAWVTDRDDIAGHDRVILTLDPFNDGRRAFEFGVSALGVQWDAVYSAQGGGGGSGPSDESWDAIWSSAGRITDEGYVVEVAIPFASLRFPAGDGPRTWGFFVSRRRPRGEDLDVRSMHWDRADACLLCQANLLTGLEGVEPGGAIQLTPTLTGSRTDAREDPATADLDAGRVDPEVGVDATWRVTSDLTLNATANPDFSQVEADAPQLDVNNRFSLFFPEKRPFFLEGADLWETPVRAVFTRTIVDPSFGAKASGKIGPSAVGLLVARDATNALTLPGSQSSSTATLPGGVTDVLARYRRDVGGASTLGAVLAAREGDGYHNRVGGADAFLRSGASTLRLQYLRSRTRYPAELAAAGGQPSGSFGGNAFAGLYGYSTRRWSVGANGFFVDRSFRADAGFVNQVDLADVWSWAERTWWAGDDAWWTAASVGTGFWFARTLSEWSPLTEGVWISASLRGPLQSRLWVNPDLARAGVDGRVLEHARVHFGGSVQPTGSVGLSLDGTAGGVVDWANRRDADQLRLSSSIDLRLGRRVDLRGSLSFQGLDHRGEPVFDATVAQLRAVYNFSSRAFARATVQHRRTDRNVALWQERVDPESTSVATQLLFSYKLNPLSVLFVGYSDSRVGGLEADGSTLDLVQSARTFFLKLGWAWRP